MKRRIIQIVSLFLTNSAFTGTLYQGPFKRFCVPFLNCYACPFARFGCPVGTLQHFIVIKQFPYYILGFIGFVGVVSGRFVCGFLCPFGLFQELLYKVKTIKIKVPRFFSYFKYMVLVIVLVIVYITGEPWFCKTCPVGTLEGAIPQLGIGSSLRNLVGWLFYMKYAILILIVTISIFIKRPFCRFICPLGAILGLLNKLTLFKLKVDKEECNECGICQKVCPMDVKIFEQTESFNCIKCLRCKSACPQRAITF